MEILKIPSTLPRIRRSTDIHKPLSKTLSRGGGERRCVATGRSGPKQELIRCIVAPNGQLVPDLAGKLPGRGIWLACNRNAVFTATKRKLFTWSAKRSVSVPEDLAQIIEDGLVERAISTLGLARRAGFLVAGMAKVEAALRTAGVMLRIEARDGAANGQRKLNALAPNIKLLSSLSMAELGRVFGRDRVVHVVYLGSNEQTNKSSLLERVQLDYARLAEFRGDINRAGLENMPEGCIEPTSELIG